MKRSDMIAEIQRIVYMASSEDLEMTIVEAEYVLDELQKLGMMPPPLNHDCYEWEPEENA